MKEEKKVIKLRRPPNAAANTVKNLYNLFKRFDPFVEADIHFSFQLNGYPHLGTLFSLTSLFAVADMLMKNRKIPHVYIEVLENAPAKIFTINGNKYAINFDHYEKDGRKIMFDYFESYSFLFQLLSKFSGISEQKIEIL